MYSIPKIRIVLALVMFLVITCELSLLAEKCQGAGGKRIINTKHTILTFNSIDDVSIFNKSIKYNGRNSSGIFFSSSNDERVEQDLVQKVDLLFEKVQLILDMRKAMRPVRIKVFSNRSELLKAYRKIFGDRGSARGWYVHEFNTVFLNARDVHEGMLAHELAHAIIDHYLEVRPPRATAEILARYVDKHLFEEVKQY